MNPWKSIRNCGNGAQSILLRFCDSNGTWVSRSSVVNFEPTGYGFIQRIHSRSFTPGMFAGDSQLLSVVGLARYVLRSVSNVSAQGKHHGSKLEVDYVSRRHKHSKATSGDLSRNFLLQLWAANKKRNLSRRKKKRLVVEDQRDYDHERNPIEPPPSQTVPGSFCSSPLEARVETLLARSNLLVTRDIEWANLVLGFEQENRYVVIDVCYPGTPAGFIREQSNIFSRQLLRSRRPFDAYIVDSLGRELFKVRRPFWWITSSIYVEIDGQVIGVVHRRWHLWRRLYDLYLGNRQFAVVENPGLWNWTFTLKDVNDKILAQIDRDWRGFGFEIFTDAGQYVIRFGSTDPDSITNQAHSIQDLEVVRPLTLSERAVAVALAISLDNDYFSRRGGWGMPFFYVEN